MHYGLSAFLLLVAIAVLAALRLGLLDGLRRRIAPPSASAAERAMTHPEGAWRLVDDPSLWPLWMPTVRELREAPRPIRPNMRIRVALRELRGVAMVRHDDPAHVVVTAYDPQRVLGFEVVVGDRVDRYRLERGERVFRASSEGPVSAETLLEQLDRETSWAGEPSPPAPDAMR